MQWIESQGDLLAFCENAKQAEFVTIDTEFLREDCFFAELCLVQLAYVDGDTIHDAVVDALAADVDLTPVIEIFCDQKIVKVFHAARQDLEIFYTQFKVLPKPFFDTQIAAMVCGFGDQIGYDALVRAYVGQRIDKSSRFTDWRKRPLSETQMEYAAADVTHLCVVYQKLKSQLENTGRGEWVAEEFEALLEPSLYEIDPENAYRRLKMRNPTPRLLAYARELAKFREEYAAKQNVPRSRVFKDDALLEAAAQRPNSPKQLRALRLWRGGVKAEVAEGALEAIERASKLKPEAYPEAIKRPQSQISESLGDLLRVYLKAQSERHAVALRLICSRDELEEFAADPELDCPLNRGWRKEIFSDDAKEIIAGNAALAADGKYVKLVPIDEL